MNDKFLALGMSMLVGYLIGSINWAIVISRIVAGEDIRKHGSNNAGATNILRRYGKLPAAITFGLDFVKGLVAVLVGRYLFERMGAGSLGGYLAGAGALFGHIFPIYFGFKGGKGIATGLGLLCALEPIAFAIVSIIFVPIVPITRYVSLASITGASFFPIVLGIVRYSQGKFDWIEIILSAVLASMLVWTHRGNLKRLLNGTERRLGKFNSEN